MGKKRQNQKTQQKIKKYIQLRGGKARRKNEKFKENKNKSKLRKKQIKPEDIAKKIQIIKNQSKVGKKKN